jgi:hypothetical protein
MVRPEKCVQWYKNGLEHHLVGKWGHQLQLAAEAYFFVPLYERFPGRWIGRERLLNWPPRSPDLIRIVGGGVQIGPTRHVGHWMAYCTCSGWLWWWRIWWNEDGQGKPKYLEKTCPSATLSPQIPLDQTRVRTRAAAVVSQRLTAWAMGRPQSWLNTHRLLLGVHQRHCAHRKSSRFAPKDYSVSRCGACGCALSDGGWSRISFRRL